MVISANNGDPLLPSPGLRGVPIDSPVTGLTQSTQPSYSSADSDRAAMTSPAPSSTVYSATASSAPR